MDVKYSAETSPSAIAIAVSTTFDDTIYLTGFFSECGRKIRPANVILGELLGFSLLMAISLATGHLLSQKISASTTGWLGILPIIVGIYGFVSFTRSEEIQSTGTTNGDSPVALPIHKDGYNTTRLKSTQTSYQSPLLDRRSYLVAAIAIANGSNNLAIYIPIFGNSSIEASLLIAGICYIAVCGWIFLSYRLTHLPVVGKVLSRYASNIFPFVLIWLGFRILHQSGTLTLP
jgi:hypothetical protein